MKSGHKGQIKSPANPPKPGSMPHHGKRMMTAKPKSMGRGKPAKSDYPDQSFGAK